MKRLLLIVLLLLPVVIAFSQCAMCTKTAASLDDKAARGLNVGIIYLALLPLAMMLFVGFTWWKRQRNQA